MNLKIENYLAQYYPQFEPDLRKIISDNSLLKTVPAGIMLMETGQYFKSSVLIVQGRVKLYRQGEEDGEFFMYYLEPGSACALSMICATKNEASQVMARTVEETVVILIPLTLMDKLMKEFKTWYYFVLETYRSRFEELLVVIDHIAFKSMDERLLHYLRNQYRDLNSRELKFTHQEIATDLNSSREVISRLLKKMEQQNWIKLHRSYVEWLM